MLFQKHANPLSMRVCGLFCMWVAHALERYRACAGTVSRMRWNGIQVLGLRGCLTFFAKCRRCVALGFFSVCTRLP